MRKWLGSILLFSIHFAHAQESTFVAFADSIFSAGEKNHDFPGLVVAYHASDTTWISSYGFNEWGSTREVHPTTKFQLGSIGKVLTAISVMQLTERGLLDLDEDISVYVPLEIRRYDQSAITLRNLLTHSAGMNDRNIGYAARNVDELTPLDVHLGHNLPSFFQPPGIDINYSNYSYALAGYVVERISGLPYPRYVQNNILEPLKMDCSLVGFDFDYQKKSEYAKGHIQTEGGYITQEEFARHTLPAGSLISNAIDMQKFMAACLQRDTILLNQRSWDILFTRQFSNHPALPGYSLGLEEQVVAGETFWAKAGMLTGFQSQIIFFPDSAALFIAINSNDDSFLEHFHRSYRKRFYMHKLMESESPRNYDLLKLVGEYRNARYDREGVENIISLFRGAFEVWEGESGLLVWHNGEMHNYYHIGDQVFQNSNDADIKMVFVDEDSIIKLYRGINIGGLSVPSTLEKTRWYNSPSFINEYYGIVPLGILLSLIPILFWISLGVIRKWKPTLKKGKPLSPVYHIISAAGILAVVIHIVQVFIPMIKSPMELLFGLSGQFILYNKLTYFIITITVGLWILMIHAFVVKRGNHVSRIFYLIFTLLMSVHSWFLVYWNFL